MNNPFLDYLDRHTGDPRDTLEWLIEIDAYQRAHDNYMDEQDDRGDWEYQQREDRARMRRWEDS